MVARVAEQVPLEVAVLEDAAQIPAYRLAQDVAIEKILAALAATRDGLGNPPATP